MAGSQPSDFRLPPQTLAALENVKKQAIEAAVRVAPYLERWRADYARMLDSVLASATQLQDLQARARESAKLLSVYYEACPALGWFPLMDVPISFVYGVVGLYNEKGLKAQTEVDALFVGLLNEPTVDGAVVEWRATHLLRRRIHLLDAAIGAHKRSEYELSIPVLLANLEGIVADIHPLAKDGERWNTKAYQARIEKVFAQETDDEYERVMMKLHEAARDFWRDVVLKSWKRGEGTAFLNRHAVLHGDDTTYGTAANSARAIMLLDFVQEGYRFVSLDGSEVYHRTTCTTLWSSTRHGRYFKSAAKAGIDGGRPCRHCKPSETASEG